jgi:putative transposase
MSTSAACRKMPIRKRLKIEGQALVFVTTTTNNRVPVFNDKTIAFEVINQFSESLEYFKVSLVAYNLMPSHLHALLGFKNIEKLSKFMQSFKILSSKRIKQLIGQNEISRFLVDGGFRFWRPRYDEFIITSEKQFKTKLEYIHDNPVKAGLANNSYGWKYSSAIDWLTDKKGILEIDKDFSWTS